MLVKRAEEQTSMHDDITDVPGIRIGHDTDLLAATGCTVILCDPAAVGGVDVRGGAPATRETDALRPMHLVEEVHAILLTGGSAFGLAAADGVMRYLEEQNKGYDTGFARVPIVPAAAIFDLGLGSATQRPDALAGYRACEQATQAATPQGNVGAGTGATVGKMTGPAYMMKGGLGSASAQLSGGIIVGAIVVVNAAGDVVDPWTQQTVAGARNPQGGYTFDLPAGSNTTIAVIATNAAMRKEEINKVAQMAHNGLAQALRPAHTMFDGDTVFALALGPRSERQADINSAAVQTSSIGATAATVLARAIVKAAQQANELHGIPGAGTANSRL
jgi:L-aminopeptidase/D-esterase-like protein